MKTIKNFIKNLVKIMVLGSLMSMTIMGIITFIRSIYDVIKAIQAAFDRKPDLSKIPEPDIDYRYFEKDVF